MKGQPEKMSLEHCSKMIATDGQEASSSEFQTTGAAMTKLRLPSLVVLVHGANRSPHSAKRRPGRPELSATVQQICQLSQIMCTWVQSILAVSFQCHRIA